MVKVKFKKARWSEERPYLYGIYEAFKLEYTDYPTEYAVHVNKDRIIIAKQDQCEEVVDVSEVIVNQITGVNDINNTSKEQFKKDVMELYSRGFRQRDIRNHLFRKYNRDKEMCGRALYNFTYRVNECIKRNKNKENKT